MEKRNVNIIINHSSGNSGAESLNYKISIPSKWMRELNITKENSRVEINFDGKEIVIKKCITTEDFVTENLNKFHTIKQFNYYNENDLCTSIYADFTEKQLKIENENRPNILLAFGSNPIPTWEDFMNFLEERCIPKSRDRIKIYLNQLGLSHYDPLDIIKITKGKMAEDNQWLEVIDLK